MLVQCCYNFRFDNIKKNLVSLLQRSEPLPKTVKLRYLATIEESNHKFRFYRFFEKKLFFVSKMSHSIKLSIFAFRFFKDRNLYQNRKYRCLWKIVKKKCRSLTPFKNVTVFFGSKMSDSIKLSIFAFRFLKDRNRYKIFKCWEKKLIYFWFGYSLPYFLVRKY